MSTVAIIGGGPSGIVAAKEAKEAGLTPILFEKADGPGGLWRSAGGGMWNGMRTNISRYTCCFSDHPWPPDAADFPTASEVEKYLQSYIGAFGLDAHQRFGARVTEARSCDGKWSIRSESSARGTRTEIFDHLIVASGVFQNPHIPDIKGLENFTGPVIHSHDYKSAQDWL